LRWVSPANGLLHLSSIGSSAKIIAESECSS
jgi:hypothetical protein